MHVAGTSNPKPYIALLYYICGVCEYSGLTEGFHASCTFLWKESLGVHLDFDLFVVEFREEDVGVLEVVVMLFSLVVWSITFRVSGHEWKTSLPERKGQHLHGIE